jgi:hypothetical protein
MTDRGKKECEEKLLGAAIHGYSRSNVASGGNGAPTSFLRRCESSSSTALASLGAAWGF